MQSRFGNYILHERVGIGGMGEVFRATKHGPDGFEVQVALKIILSHLAREEPFRKRFSREARLAALLKHPNIVQVNGFDIIDGTPFIEMEYVEGGDLRRVIRSEPGAARLSTEESVAILYAVARGLQHAHSHGSGESAEGGIIHCDLNPHNILISTMGEVKVTDFGIARAAMGDAAASATVRGKLAYMSPEQMEGRELDRRTDLFSLGIIAYQLLSGIHPFERSSEAATIAAIGRAEHLPLREAVGGLPAALYSIIDRLLEPLPEKRHKSADEVVNALEPLLHPSAYSSLSRKAESLLSETPYAVGGRGGDSPTSPTVPLPWTERFRPYLLLLMLAACLSAAVYFLPGGAIKHHAPASPAAAAKVPPLSSEVQEQATLPAYRTVTVESEPPGALIMAGRAALGIAPVEVTRDPEGSLPGLEARLYGFRNKPFQIPPEYHGRFQVNLEPLPTGTVRISARPWARVIFRDKPVGETPLLMKDIPVGKHTFLLDYDPMGIERAIEIQVREGINTVAVDMREKQ